MNDMEERLKQNNHILTPEDLASVCGDIERLHRFSCYAFAISQVTGAVPKRVHGHILYRNTSFVFYTQRSTLLELSNSFADGLRVSIYRSPLYIPDDEFERVFN